MTTIMLFKKGDGTLDGRCDARCYNAKGDRCKCICDGHNHGVGLNQAIENAHIYKDLIQDGQDAGEFIIRPGQLQFFTEEKP